MPNSSNKTTALNKIFTQVTNKSNIGPNVQESLPSWDRFVFKYVKDLKYKNISLSDMKNFYNHSDEARVIKFKHNVGECLIEAGLFFANMATELFDDVENMPSSTKVLAVCAASALLMGGGTQLEKQACNQEALEQSRNVMTVQPR